MTRNELAEAIAWAYQHCGYSRAHKNNDVAALEAAHAFLDSACPTAESLEDPLWYSLKHMLIRELACTAWKVLFLLYELEEELSQPEPAPIVVARLIEKIRECSSDPIVIAVWPYKPIAVSHSRFTGVPLVRRGDLLERHWPPQDYLLAMLAWASPRTMTVAV